MKIQINLLKMFCTSKLKEIVIGGAWGGGRVSAQGAKHMAAVLAGSESSTLAGPFFFF